MEHLAALSEVKDKLDTMAADYLLHRYEVANDNHVWPIIRNCKKAAQIDFSENLGTNTSRMQTKLEPQSLHFFGWQISLRCTLLQEPSDCGDSILDRLYLYHLSDVLKHDVSFVYMVLVDIMNKYFADLTVVCIKSDNCRVQYKCKWVFAMLRKLAISYNKLIIWYYGVNNHGKGMVDGMSSFGVKQPMRNEIIKRDWYFSNASDVLQLLEDKFSSDNTKSYVCLPQITSVRNEVIEIKGNTKCRMIVYNPDGSICIKRHICACDNCLEGDVLRCLIEPGEKVTCKIVQHSEDSDNECDDDEHDDLDRDADISRRTSVNFDVAQVGSIKALYTPTNVFEAFYLCKVVATFFSLKTFSGKMNVCWLDNKI